MVTSKSLPDSLRLFTQVLQDREVVLTAPKGEIRGVVIALHGCLQYVTQFGFASPSCPTCHGGACCHFPVNKVCCGLAGKRAGIA